MPSTPIRIATACACLATSLAGCASSSRPTPEIRITLPPAPDDLAACFKQAFPDIPDRSLTTRDIVRIVGRAKALDRAKSACGARATQWIESVRRDYAREP